MTAKGGEGRLLADIRRDWLDDPPGICVVSGFQHLRRIATLDIDCLVRRVEQLEEGRREVGTLGSSRAEVDAYDRIYSVIGDCDAISLDRYLAEYRQAVLDAERGREAPQ